MNRSLTVLGLTFLLTASAACSDDGADPGQPIQTDAPATTLAGSVAAADSVDGRRFVGDASGVSGHTLVEGTQLSLRFNGTEVSASGGCNTLQGQYMIDSSNTLVIDQMSATAMWCDTPGLNDQDEWLSAFLQNRPAIRVDGPTLLVSGDSVGITLTDREVADPDRPLEGTTWTVSGQISGQTASHSLVAAPATLTFADGVLAVHTGCNTGSAAYELGAGNVTVEPVALTRMACDDATMQQEAAIVTVLDGTVTYEIDAGQLTLRNGSNGLTLTTD
jgi:heat shock protein HslJ